MATLLEKINPNTVLLGAVGIGAALYYLKTTDVAGSIVQAGEEAITWAAAKVEEGAVSGGKAVIHEFGDTGSDLHQKVLKPIANEIVNPKSNTGKWFSKAGKDTGNWFENAAKDTGKAVVGGSKAVANEFTNPKSKLSKAGKAVGNEFSNPKSDLRKTAAKLDPKNW